MNNNLISCINKYMQSDDRKKLFNIVCDIDNHDLILLVVDYFINKRDSFYICEILSYNDDSIVENTIFNKILETNDTEFIYKISINGPIQGVVSLNNLKRLKDTLNNFLKD